MITVTQIHKEVAAVRPCSRRQLHRYIRAAGVRPFTEKIKPFPYPDDAAQKVIAHLGLAGIPTMNQLRDIRRRAAQARR